MRIATERMDDAAGGRGVWRGAHSSLILPSLKLRRTGASKGKLDLLPIQVWPGYPGWLRQSSATLRYDAQPLWGWCEFGRAMGDERACRALFAKPPDHHDVRKPSCVAAR